MGKGWAIVTLVAVVLVVSYFAYPSINSLIQQSGSDKVTLPIGTIVSYNQQSANTYPEYRFRYGGVLGDNPNSLQVWAGSNSAFPEEFTFTKDSTLTAFAIQITVSEVHSDYIVILVKHLS
jgi:hypothetical protein